TAELELALWALTGATPFSRAFFTPVTSITTAAVTAGPTVFPAGGSPPAPPRTSEAASREPPRTSPMTLAVLFISLRSFRQYTFRSLLREELALIVGAASRRNVKRVDAILEFVRRGLIQAVASAGSVVEAEGIFA